MLVVFGWIALAIAAQAASFNCGKAATRVEGLICGNSEASRVDEDVQLAYLRALERTDDRQKVMQSQRNWLKNIRNVCTDTDCLYKVYVNREYELDAIPPGKCYWLEPPIKDKEGKRHPIEPICREMERNLNHFCNQPPMVCGLKIAPEFRHEFTLPTWTPLNIQTNHELIQEFVHAPNEVRRNQYSGAVWAQDQSQLDAAFVSGRMTFSKGVLDLYGLGKPQTTYRLDYGNCQADNPQLKNPSQWGKAIHAPKIRTQYAPETVRSLFTEYFSVDTYLNEVFLYKGRVYDFIMDGSINQAVGTDDYNQMLINRHDQRTDPSGLSLWMNNICTFNYEPLKGLTK